MYKLNYFNFKEKNNNYLLTNDMGEYSFIEKEEFTALVNKNELKEATKKELLEKGFIYETNKELFAEDMYLKLRKQKEYLLSATTLHIFVVSKNCNFNCIYCQAGNLNQKHDYKMTIETAKRSVDIALQAPNKYLSFEFQGGEPLTNFNIIKYIVEYSKENANGKQIDYNVVSNLTLLTDEMIDFFIANNVSICTSIDGNEELQNKNRPYKNGNSYRKTVEQIKKLREKGINVSAIETTTKYSLNNFKEIVDEYIKLNFNSVFIRPLTKLGKADSNWNKIGYSAEEFLKFYKNSLEYIIEKNKEGIFLIEGHSNIF